MRSILRIFRYIYIYILCIYTMKVKGNDFTLFTSPEKLAQTFDVSATACQVIEGRMKSSPQTVPEKGHQMT
uniref:Putative secreted protein n=1 Tax=Anopheles triannulatus TaxID=58253 RepID=A0A2M4B4W0_9DIPT